MDWIDVQWTIAITEALHLGGRGGRKWPVSLLKVPKAPVA